MMISPLPSHQPNNSPRSQLSSTKNLFDRCMHDIDLELTYSHKKPTAKHTWLQL